MLPIYIHMLRASPASAIVAALSVLLVACSSSSGADNPIADSISDAPLEYVVGFKIVDRSKPTQRQLRIVGDVFKFEQTVNRAEFIRRYRSTFTLSQDSCEQFNSELEFPDFAPVAQHLPIAIGESVVFSFADGTFATAALKTEDDRPYYEYGFIVSTEHSPNGLTFSTPGGVIPAMNNQPFVDSVPMELLAPTAGTLITTQTEFEWQAGSGDYLYLRASNGVNSINCYLVDDGRFTLPSQVAAMLGTNTTIVDFEIERRKTTIRDVGDTLVVNIRESSISNHDSFVTLP